MQLEQMMYQPMQAQRTEQAAQRTYAVVDLDYLSASALYTGRPCGESAPRLTIRPIGPNTQLHIHEGSGGTAHIKTRQGEYQNLNSYEAAMLDLQMDRAGILRIKK
jgi:hypothetical protein